MKEIVVVETAKQDFYQIVRETGRRTFRFVRLVEPPVVRIGDNGEDHVSLVQEIDQRRIADAGFLSIEANAVATYKGPTVFFTGSSSSLRKVVPDNGRVQTSTLFNAIPWIEVNE